MEVLFLGRLGGCTIDLRFMGCGLWLLLGGFRASVLGLRLLLEFGWVPFVLSSFVLIGGLL